MISALVVWLAASLMPSPTSAQEPAKKPSRIGQIYIVGNEITQENVVRAAIELYPGEVLRPGDLGKAEKRLRDLHIFDEKDPPRITILSNLGGDPGWQDLCVRVREAAAKGAVFVRGRFRPPIGWQFTLVIEGHNFDPWRFPTSWADIEEGKAFRGAGIKMSVEVLRINVTPFPYLTNTIQFFPSNKRTTSQKGGRVSGTPLAR